VTTHAHTTRHTTRHTRLARTGPPEGAAGDEEPQEDERERREREGVEEKLRRELAVPEGEVEEGRARHQQGHEDRALESALHPTRCRAGGVVVDGGGALIVAGSR